MTAERIPPLLALAARYEIVRELGRGGTAVVYLARERATGAEVAIKLIHARYAEDAEAVARFAREARFVAELDHPNIVRVHEVLHLGDGGIALVMAHVAGRTLKQRIGADGPLSPADADRVVRDVAAALGAAHARGIVHRDVKPENVFIDQDGRALLADFGVARSMSAETQQLTMHGVAIGTPTYMAPEQIDGGELDGRGDIYSLGLVAWEMLTGRRPWEGEALYSVLYHQKHVRLPAVGELRDDVPPHLAGAIEGAIEKERECRWQRVDELIAALDGNAPERRAPTVAPLGNETVQFVREPAVAAGVAVALVPAAAATAAAVPGAVPARERMHPSTRVIVAGALVSLLALVLVAGGVQAWSDGVARRGRHAQSVAPPPTRAVSAGIVGSGSATTPLGVSTADSVHVGDAPAGIAIPATLPAVVPVATAAGARADSTPRAAPTAATAVAPTPPPAAPPAAAPRPTPSVIVPSRPSAVTSRMRIVTGGRHTCLLTADGRGFCWGGNDRGQLGIGASGRAATPTRIATEQRFATVAPGLSHSCALDEDGAAWCWGENDRGQLGDGTTSPHDTPARVADGHRFRSISAGASHSCGLDLFGAAWCWGANGFGQLGDGQARDRTTPVAVATSRRFVSLNAGWNFTCALDDDGRATCWGDDGAGQLGDGGSSSRRFPAAVQGRLAFASVSAGNAHACGITVGGDAYCWGANTSGQLGDGTATDRAAPVRVGGGGAFTSIEAGAVHSCALTAEGEAFCWGRNTYGQLGDGGTDDHPLPVRVAGGHTFTTIRAFGSHTCATTASGEAFCWGYNLDGQLGDGTRTHRTRPVYVERPGGR
jgi:alpha-tubulin suppressor-like RCC1 family protein